MVTIKTFTSPINLDDGTHHRFMGHARSVMTFMMDGEEKTALSGSIRWNYTFIDGVNKDTEGSEHITLWFDRGRRLVDFDGVHELPVEAVELLEGEGFDCTIAKS